MGKHYDESIIPSELRRDFDVYERIDELGIDVGSFDENVVSLAGAPIAGESCMKAASCICRARRAAPTR